MRIVFTGREGQVARALRERGPACGAQVIPTGRPELDLSAPETILPVLRACAPEVIVNTAAYTMVDQAEAEPDLAESINGRGASAVAVAAAELSVPIIQISTDYVFDGSLDRPYTETDTVGPTGVYGRSKLSGERGVASATSNYAILRTAWVYSPFGRNFVRTMLRLAETRDEVSVVVDQHGSPTNAIDIADGIIAVARNLLQNPDPRMRGVFHMTGSGFATWAEFASAVFETSKTAGGPSARVRPIVTADYPTPAKRPANSRLDCTRIAIVHRVKLPGWRASLIPCVRRLISKAAS